MSINLSLCHSNTFYVTVSRSFKVSLDIPVECQTKDNPLCICTNTEYNIMFTLNSPQLGRTRVFKQEFKVKGQFQGQKVKNPK